MALLIENFDKDSSDPMKKAWKKKNEVTDIRKGKVNRDVNNFDLDIVLEQEDSVEDAVSDKENSDPNVMRIDEIEEEEEESEKEEKAEKEPPSE